MYRLPSALIQQVAMPWFVPQFALTAYTAGNKSGIDNSATSLTLGIRA